MTHAKREFYLTAQELHALWLQVPEERRLAFMTSLEACCWQSLAQYQVDLHAHTLDLSEPRRSTRGSVSPIISLANVGRED